MLKEQIAFLLQKYLGNYVKDISQEALKISAWQGNVELTNMQLKPEALNALNLPIKVKAGFLGSVKLKVPWSKLGSEPVIVLLDRIFVLAEPPTDIEYSGDIKIQESKRQKIKETERALLDAKLETDNMATVNNSWLGSFISTIIGNLKLSITNIHIRYEDSQSNSGHPFAIGLTLKRLAAVTVDEDGREKFISSGPLDRIQKAAELEGLALYLDPDSKPWDSKQPWENLSPLEWDEFFEPHIDAHPGRDNGAIKSQCHYLLQPVGASASYKKLGKGDARSKDKEMQKAVFKLNDVTLSFSQAQYRDMLKLAENFSSYRKRLQYAGYRPASKIKEDPKLWWKYAYRVTVEQVTKASGRVSWKRIVHFARLRKKYLSIYIKCLQSNPNLVTCHENKEIQEIECDVDVDVAVQWRMLAHSYVDRSRQDGNRRQKQSTSGWWSFLWGSQSSEESSEQRAFTEEDWQQINKFIGYEEGNESSILPGHDPPDMLHTVLEIHMEHNATKLLDENYSNVIGLSAEDLKCSAKIYGEMKMIDFKLGSFKVSSPEGLLAESEAQKEAVGGEFILQPLGKNLDWSLCAKASPCYISYLKASIDEVTSFFQNRDAISQMIALETAAALQATFDEMARNAQQQLNDVLKQKPRFSLQLDIAAPKVIILSDFYPDGKQQSKLLLDLGHLTLQTEDTRAAESDEELDLYIRFKIGLTDVEAFLVDGIFNWREHYNVSSGSPEKVKFQETTSYLPVLERCGITMALQQIYVPHPDYPATRLSVRLPSLGFHLSPARYHRLLQILKVFQDSTSDEQGNLFRPWDPADFEGEVSVLVWKGVGNREAVWQYQYAALAGPFLYILDSSSASTSKRRLGLYGKQVHLVSPEYIGGVQNVLAVCDGGIFSSKIMESLNTLLLRFDCDELREAWKGRLQGAIYHSSSPASVNGTLSAEKKEESEKEALLESYQSSVFNSAEKEIFFLAGALDELKIVISSGPTGIQKSKEHLLLVTERPLLELRASGSKIEFVTRKHDMAIGAILQTLEIEDKYFRKETSEHYYLACSDIKEPDDVLPKINEELSKTGKALKQEKETFLDSQELGEKNLQRSNYSGNMSIFYDAAEFDPEWLSLNDPPKFIRIPSLLPDPSCPKEGYLEDKIQESFVKAQITIYSLDSPAYRHVDKQIMVSLGTLRFFCIRPTIMALLNFMDAITTDVLESTSGEDEKDTISNQTIASDNGEPQPSVDQKESVVKGLLGSGKERTLFSLMLNIRHAVFILNSDDGSKIASLAQEHMSCNIQIFPSSFAISASLGNLRISDGSVGAEHPYNFICDTRNPDSSSFIEMEFCSFSKDDNDYEGYEYSLVGKLSEIRFVYLNRFIQEISTYFMGMVPQSPGNIVKINNKVTDVEKLFTQSEVEGSPAIRFDVTLTKPILIMPRDTNSIDFLELDVLHIKVTNSVQWIGGGQEDPAAVRLDTTVLHIEDVHLSVGLHGISGEGIIKKVNGLALTVTRSLRDLWHQVPIVDASIKIEELKADISDKEYQVITECALSNLSEKANLSPAISLPESDAVKEKNEEVDGKHGLFKEKSTDATWTTIMVSVELNLVELSLFKGTAREQRLATAQLSGVCITFQSNSTEESDIMASLKSLTLKDDREGTDPVLAYMIGKTDDMEYHVKDKLSEEVLLCGSFGDIDASSPSNMLVMDAKLSSTMQMVSLRVQQLKLLVAVDFLLAIAEFFVPSLLSKGSDLKETEEDPMNLQVGVYLDQPMFRQEDREMILSPRRPLIVECVSIDEYIYDGGGGSICLQNDDGTTLHEMPPGPCILIGSGKYLRFKNVTIQSGELLDSCILLGINSHYSVLEADGVFLQQYSSVSDDEMKGQRTVQMEYSTKEMMFDLQAIGLELTFYDSGSQYQRLQVIERLIRAKVDAFSRFILKGSDMELSAKLKSLSLDASSGLCVIEPVDAEVNYSSVSGKQDIHIMLSNVFTNLSFSVLQLVLRLQEDISSFLRITTRQATIRCYEFDKIWTEESSSREQKVTFWRARPPPGFTILGDCITPSDEPLSKGVLAVNMSLSWFRRPTGFEKVWSSVDSDSGSGCCVWKPICPAGYVSLGCVAMQGVDEPSRFSVACVKERVVTSSSWMDCILLQRNDVDAYGSFWRVDNSLGSFFVERGMKEPRKDLPFELLYVASTQGFPRVQKIDRKAKLITTDDNSEQGQSSFMTQPTVEHLYQTLSEFRLIWSSESNDSSGQISIWRPELPAGCTFVGDIAVQGHESPDEGIILRSQHDDVLLKKPLYFKELAHIRKDRNSSEVFFWLPIAPAGFSALGCICSNSSRLDPELLSSVRCIRNDIVVPVQYGGKVGEAIQARDASQVVNIWCVKNKMGTFIAQKGLKAPPKRLALCIAELDGDNYANNIVADAKLRTFSAVVYDDFCGLMTPILNITLSGVNASAHGHSHSLQSSINFSFAAETYNTKCFAWEPVVEPFEAIVRHKYQSISSHGENSTVSEIRFVSISALNVNASVTNVNMLLEAYESWNILSKLMERSKHRTMGFKTQSDCLERPVLDFNRNKAFKVIHHNKLGEDILIQFMESSGQPKTITLPSGCRVSLNLPTPSSILDPRWKGNIKKSVVKMITLFLGSAKIPHTSRLTRQKYMAALRIFPEFQNSDRCQLNEQSAHTRFVYPVLISNSEYQALCWNEAFLFKLEDGDNYIVEITVTEISSGSAVGNCLVHLSADEQTVSGVEIEGGSPAMFVIGMKWEPLRQYDKDQEKSTQGGWFGEIYYGVHTLSIAHDEETKPVLRQKCTNQLEKGADLVPGTIKVSFKAKESWTQIGLNYAASATCWHLNDDTIATDTAINDMEKQLTFRSLAVVMNATDFPLDLALSSKECNKEIPPNDQVTSITDEVFENERHQPLLGWGSSWPGHLLPMDPQHWSNRDGSGSTKEFPEVPLPLGWQWEENWKVDTRDAADENGWSYAFDFTTQNWPPEDNKTGATKFIRRRRWIRSRKCVRTSSSTLPLLIATLNPGETNPLPIRCLCPEGPDYILKFRPEAKNSDGKNKYRWSNTVLCKVHSEIRGKQEPISEISLHSLVELEELICSSVEEASSSEPSKSIWFVVDVKARERGMSSQLDPLQDWKISVMAPLILHNYLPVLSEYSVLEKCEGNGFILRQNGVIEPGKEAHVYTTDIRKAIYLTWIPQGGWQPEEVPALISHPLKPAVKHIYLENFSTGRLLRVLVDDCSDAKEFSAKRIRFYVPCWLDVKNVPPLRCIFTELISDNKWRFESKSRLHKKIEVIEHEEMNGPYAMVSNLSLEKMGMSVDLSGTNEVFIGDAKSLETLSQADGFVELRALNNVASVYYKIFATLKLCPYPSIPTKVLMLRPYMTFTNRLGEIIFLKQTNSDEPKMLNPFDYRTIFPCPQTDESEGLQVSFDGLHWSLPLVIMQEETLHIPLWKSTSRNIIRIEIRGYEEGSRFLVIFRRGSSFGPYRLENHMRYTELKYRQSGLSDGLWQSLQPGSTNLYTWENPHEEQFLEVLIVQNGISISDAFDINKFGNHLSSRNDNLVNVCCRVLEVAGSLKVVRFCELNRSLEIEETSSIGKKSFFQMAVQLEVKQLGISVIDLKLHEIVYLCMEGISFRYATAHAGKGHRFKLLLGYLQLDNQLPMSVLPVIFAPEGKHDLANPVLKISVKVSDSDLETTDEFYPYIGVEVTRHSWRVNIHEPIIWAVLDFYRELRLGKIAAGSDIGLVDPEVRIEYMSISETRLKLTLETAPMQRPRGVLGIWSPFVTALGNTSKMPIHLRAINRKNRYMHKSAITAAILDRLRRDLIHNPLMLLSGLDVLGITSSTLATLSGTVAQLSSDGKFLQLRSKQDRSRRIAGVGDGIVQGTEAIAQGVAFGVSGMLSKPIENAKEKGLAGFVQGLGKAAIGIVMEPMSGVLDFVSLTVNGVGASYTRCLDIFQQKPAYDRIRPPRSVSPDGILHCYDEKAAKGQFILQLAEGRAGFVQGLLFREPSKFAWSDMYEDHFYIMNQRIVMVTTKRIMLLKCPKVLKNSQTPLHSFILWDVQWEDLLALEMACSGVPHSPIYAVLHLCGATADHVHVVKCSSNNSEDEYEHTRVILGSISKSWKKYRPSREAILQELITKHQHRVSSVPSTSSWVIRSAHKDESSEQGESNEMSVPGSSSENIPGKMFIPDSGNTKQVFNFMVIWTSEQKDSSCCVDAISSKENIITIWRPIVPEGYISIGDIAHKGRHQPLLSISYIDKPGMFAHPTGFDLVWRSWKEGYLDPICIWAPRAPDGYTALGCIAVAAFIEPDIKDVWCAHLSLVEDADFEDEEIWHTPNNSVWDCFFYQIASEALTFMAVRRPQLKTQLKPKKILPDRLSNPIS